MGCILFLQREIVLRQIVLHIHNVNETIRTLKNSFAGLTEDDKPMLELKNESETW